MSVRYQYVTHVYVVTYWDKAEYFLRECVAIVVDNSSKYHYHFDQINYTLVSIMPRFYKTVQDDSLPPSLGSTQNIVLTLPGMQALSVYYKNKYNVDIFPIGITMDNAAERLSKLIQEIKQSISQDFYRCAFILHQLDAGHHGHSMTVIWEKQGEQDHLFFLDSGQFLGNTSYDSRDCDMVNMPLFSSNTDLTTVPGESPTAYVLSDQDLFYIDKNSQKIANLSTVTYPWSDRPRRYRDKCVAIKNVINAQQLLENQATKLSEEQLSGIRTMISHDINIVSRKPKQFREALSEQLPNITFWSQLGQRQLDLSSCMIDAMVIAKDGLRIKPHLLDLANSKFIEEKQGVNLFCMPEELLKTAQIDSFVRKESKAELEKIIHVHHEKNASGEQTGNDVSITLGQFRARYDVSVQVRSAEKLFGTYTIHKGEKIAALLDRRALLDKPVPEEVAGACSRP